MISPPDAARMARHKQFLRGYYRHQVSRLSSAARRALSAKAVRRLALLPAFQAAQTVGIYAGVEGELDTTALFDLCGRTGKAVAVPVVFPASTGMEFSLLRPPVRWIWNIYGIAEPRDKSLIDPGHLELLVVPGRAFSTAGVRLGRGAGYYDRFLSAHPRVMTAALAFDEQVAAALPCDDRDRPVDWVVTPTRVHSREKSRA
jgi:5-formyltetrahydrofolate cyclo-ligase